MPKEDKVIFFMKYSGSTGNLTHHPQHDHDEYARFYSCGNKDLLSAERIM